MEKRRLSQAYDGNDGGDKEDILEDAGTHPVETKKPRWVVLEGGDAGQRNEGETGEEGSDNGDGSGSVEVANAAWELANDSLKQKNILVDPPVDDGSSFDIPSKTEAPGSSGEEAPRDYPSHASEIHQVLAKSEVLTGDAHRDKWLERLAHALLCFNGNESTEKRNMSGSTLRCRAFDTLDTINDPRERLSSLDTVVTAIVALERTAHGALGSDFRKYNQKMRQLLFNLKNNDLLAKRFLKKELKPSVIIDMAPQELKDGLTAAEKEQQEPEGPQYIQMTDSKCSMCMEKRVGVVDIIHAGGSGDRYQLECAACGHTCSATADAISSLTVEEPE